MRATIRHREHIICFIAHKLFFLERNGQIERYNRMMAVFEQVDLDRLLRCLSVSCAAGGDCRLDDLFLEQGEAAFTIRRGGYRYLHIFREGRLSLTGIEAVDAGRWN